MYFSKQSDAKINIIMCQGGKYTENVMIIKVINNSFISLVNFVTLIKVFFNCIVQFVKEKVGRNPLRLLCMKHKFNYITKCIKPCMATIRIRIYIF